MRVRKPVVAGRFYAADSDQCRKDMADCLIGAVGVQGVQHLIGGIVPHAGWMCSGAVAAKVFYALAEARSGAARPTKTIVLFGGVHRSIGPRAAIFSDGRWETPIVPVQVDGELAQRILNQTDLVVDDHGAHAAEHSIEVQMPFIAHVFPEAKVVPIMVPPGPAAHEVGEAVGRALTDYDRDAYVIGTTDLTHYGPSYAFIPQGIGAGGNAWAKDKNDKSFIELVCALRSREVVPEAADKRNACSSGAVAATLGAVVSLGATKGILLEHTSSSEVLGETGLDEYSDSVGYAGILFAR